MELKDKIKKYRKDNGLTQQELGDKLGLGRSTIAEIERGRIKGKLAIINKFSVLSGMSLSSLMDNNNEENIAVGNHEALDILLDTMIEKEIIKSDNKIPEEYYSIIIGLLEKELNLKREKATK